MARKPKKGTEAGCLHAGERAKWDMPEGEGNAPEGLAKPACSQ